MSSAQQQLVGAMGVGLVVANVWTTQRTDFAGLFGDGDLDKGHTAAKQVGAELIGVAALVLIAGTGGPAGNAAVAALLGLWILWLIKRSPTTSTRTKQSAPTRGTI